LAKISNSSVAARKAVAVAMLAAVSTKAMRPLRPVARLLQHPALLPPASQTTTFRSDQEALLVSAASFCFRKPFWT
jgi:hypothetical protein